MKKCISLLTIIIAALLLTGCNKSKMNCSIAQTKEIMGFEVDMNQEVVVNFDNDKVDKLNLVSTAMLSEESYNSLKTNEEIQDLTEKIEECLKIQLEKNDTTSSSKVTSSHDGRKIQIKIDYSKINSLGDTKEKTRQYLVNVGFSCK